jgi:hypothetical protein
VKRSFEILGTVMAWLLFGIMGLIVVSLALRILPVMSGEETPSPGFKPPMPLGTRTCRSVLRHHCAVAGHPGHLSRDIVDTLGRLALIDLPRVDTEPPEELALD